MLCLWYSGINQSVMCNKVLNNTKKKFPIGKVTDMVNGGRKTLSLTNRKVASNEKTQYHGKRTYFRHFV